MGTAQTYNTRNTNSPNMDNAGFPSKTQKPSTKKGMGIIMDGYKQLETITEILRRYCHLTGHLLKLRLVSMCTCQTLTTKNKQLCMPSVSVMYKFSSQNHETKVRPLSTPAMHNKIQLST
jgi:hypothetical protein